MIPKKRNHTLFAYHSLSIFLYTTILFIYYFLPFFLNNTIAPAATTIIATTT